MNEQTSLSSLSINRNTHFAKTKGGGTTATRHFFRLIEQLVNLWEAEAKNS